KVLLATASDSLNDVFATSAVILSTLVSHYLALNIDGYISAAVSVMIMVVGIRLAVDTANVLLGSAPSPETVSQLEAFLSESPHVLGIHDLIVHDYGPGRKFASVHAEVSDREDITTIHEEIDAYEQRALKEFGMELVIHMDPISTDDTVLQGTHGQVVAAVRRFGDYPIHDFRMTDGENRINLIFDIVVPCSMTKEQRRMLVDGIKAALKAEDERYVAVIHVDDDYSMPRK
ncbi:MAG: hypothetical protein IJC25_00365, partial [Clostridia bacterium]|nr:hypothetical protein [Clostridia bacterium]